MCRDKNMNKSPKISIVIPVYNVENYLSKCLESVVSQTLLDIEIICVDDGTKDQSCRIVENYQRYDNRITLIHKSNGGLSSARNVGMQHANGSYICFLDSDDYIEPNACERLYMEILENSPDIISFGANCFPIYPSAGQWLDHILSPRTTCYNEDGVNALLKENGAYPFVWRQCYRQDFLKSNYIEFDENVKFGEDLVFQFCAFPLAKKIIFLSDKLYNYRWYRENSLMHVASQNLFDKYMQHLKLVDIIFDFWEEHNLLSQYKNELFDWSISFMGYDLKNFKEIDKSKILASQLFIIWEKYHFSINSACIENKNLLKYLRTLV